MAELFPQYGYGGLPYNPTGDAFGKGGMPMFGAGTPGSNQFVQNNPATMPMPGNTSMSAPGIVPPSSSPVPPGFTPNTVVPSKQGSFGLPGGQQTIPTFDPYFTSQFYSWLTSQLGKGATPFDLSAILPSTGQATAPGTLTAPLNPIESSLQQFYATGTGGPLPGVLPMWNAEIAAMNGPQGPTAQAEAQLRGQFAFGGDLASSPFAQAETQFAEQNILNQNALLTSATQAALPTMASFGENLQQLDQSSINNLLQEFIRTRPEYSPLLNMLFGGATSSPGTYGKPSGAGAIGGILSGAGSAMEGIAALAALCWIAEVLYGVNDTRTHTVRAFLLGDFGKTWLGSKIVFLYKKFGKRIAAIAKQSSLLRTVLKPIFNWFLKEAQNV